MDVESINFEEFMPSNDPNKDAVVKTQQQMLLRFNLNLPLDIPLDAEKVMIYWPLIKCHSRLQKEDFGISVNDQVKKALEMLRVIGFESPMDKRIIPLNVSKFRDWYKRTYNSQVSKNNMVKIANDILETSYGIELISTGKGLYRLNTFDLWDRETSNGRLFPKGLTPRQTDRSIEEEFNEIKKKESRDRLKMIIKNKSSVRKRKTVKAKESTNSGGGGYIYESNKQISGPVGV